MTERERFIASLTFMSPDKFTLEPGSPRESTLARWHEEGLPKYRNYFDYLCEILAIDISNQTPRIKHSVSFTMIPEYEEKILEHKEGHYIVQDWMGAITEISDCFDLTYLRSARDFVTRKWHKFPVETHGDWEQMKRRYKVNTPGRFPEDFKERCSQLHDRDYPVSVSINGPFWQLREWCGFENLCIMMIEKPDFVEEMARFWADFVSQVMDVMLEDFCPDRVIVSEDMAYKVHSMISPKMVYQYLMPVYDQWIPKFKAKGCPVIDMDSDGYIAELIPLWIEAGFNCCSPLEVAAGNDIVKYRCLYGRKMAFRGGIDKRALAKGGETMRKEVMRVVPPLLEEGGCILGCDHGVPSDISWADFIEYTQVLAKLSGWIKTC